MKKLKERSQDVFFFGVGCFDKTRKDTLNPLGRLFFRVLKGQFTQNLPLFTPPLAVLNPTQNYLLLWIEKCFSVWLFVKFLKNLLVLFSYAITMKGDCSFQDSVRIWSLSHWFNDSVSELENQGCVEKLKNAAWAKKKKKKRKNMPSECCEWWSVCDNVCFLPTFSTFKFEFLAIN